MMGLPITEGRFTHLQGIGRDTMFRSGWIVAISLAAAAGLAAQKPTPAHVGESIIIAPGPSWPCAPSQASLPELMKLQTLMLDENAPDSIMDRLTNALMRTKSIMVGTKDTVTVLEVGAGFRKVSVAKRKPSAG